MRQEEPGPTPLRRAVIGLALGVGVGAMLALAAPRRSGTVPREPPDAARGEASG